MLVWLLLNTFSGYAKHEIFTLFMQHKFREVSCYTKSFGSLKNINFFKNLNLKAVLCVMSRDVHGLASEIETRFKVKKVWERRCSEIDLYRMCNFSL